MKSLVVVLCLCFALGCGSAEVYSDSVEYETELYEGEIDLLANLVRAEAGNQDLKGKQLVVDTVLNRCDSEQFPNTVDDVIYSKYAFSCINNGYFDRVREDVTEEDYSVVYASMRKRLSYKVLYFRTDRYSDYGTELFKHGDHYFSGR